MIRIIKEKIYPSSIILEGFLCPISNECQAEDGLNFNFSYDNTSGKHGYMDSNGNFVPFESGGTDVSDTTATAATVRNGYYFYNAQGVRTLGTYTGMDTSDATAYARNIETGYTAYCRGSKITGTAYIEHKVYKYNNTYSLSGKATGNIATSVGDYALFGTTYQRGSYTVYTYIEAYNTSLSKSKPTGLSQDRFSFTASRVGNYSLFGGGAYYKYNTWYSTYDTEYTNVVDAYNTSLVRSIPTPLSSIVHNNPNSANNLLYSLFWYSSIMDAYNNSLVKSSVTSLPSAINSCAATNIGDYAIITGSNNNGITDIVEVYDASLTKSTITPLSQARANLAATSIGNYALFGGGYGYNNSSQTSFNRVDAYNTTLTRSTATALSVATYSLAATSVGDYAIFGGGDWNSVVVTAYNTSLMRSIPDALSKGRSNLAATSNPKYALFGGGRSDTSPDYEQQYVVDVYYSN